MTGQTFFDEVFIPPCVVETRLEHPNNRAARNAATLPGAVDRSRAFPGVSITWSNAGDGDVLVACPGNDMGCTGGEVKVDRHDLLQDTIPGTTLVIGTICTSTAMLYRDGYTLKSVQVDHTNVPRTEM